MFGRDLKIKDFLLRTISLLISHIWFIPLPPCKALSQRKTPVTTRKHWNSMEKEAKNFRDVINGRSQSSASWTPIKLANERAMVASRSEKVQKLKIKRKIRLKNRLKENIQTNFLSLNHPTSQKRKISFQSQFSST